MGSVASNKVEFRYLQLGVVISVVYSEQQDRVPLSPTGWGFQWRVSGAREVRKFF